MTALLILIPIAGCLVAAPAIYLAILSCAAFGYRQDLEGFVPRTRIVVLIPAHDEELLISRTLGSLNEQRYPRGLFRTVVVADNCTDGTAEVARAAGADQVMVRDAADARGKGRALRWAMDQILAVSDAPDAIVCIDADTTADPNLLLGLAERFEHGADVVQADYRTFVPGSAGTSLRSTAFILMNWVRPAGRNVLGLAAFLVGNGMLLGRSVLERRPWTAYSATEDREYTLDLQYDGVFVALAGAVAVHAPMAPSASAAATQQQRWEGGWAYLLRVRFLRLLKDGVSRRSIALLMAAFDLAVPPLGLLAAATVLSFMVAGIPAALGAWSPMLMIPSIVGSGAIVVYVIAGLAAVAAPRSAYLALLQAPLFILKKPLSLGRTLRFRADTWVRTERAGDGSADR